MWNSSITKGIPFKVRPSRTQDLVYGQVQTLVMFKKMAKWAAIYKDYGGAVCHAAPGSNAFEVSSSAFLCTRTDFFQSSRVLLYIHTRAYTMQCAPANGRHTRDHFGRCKHSRPFFKNPLQVLPRNYTVFIFNEKKYTRAHHKIHLIWFEKTLNFNDFILLEKFTVMCLCICLFSKKKLYNFLNYYWKLRSFENDNFL